MDTTNRDHLSNDQLSDILVKMPEHNYYLSIAMADDMPRAEKLRLLDETEKERRDSNGKSMLKPKIPTQRKIKAKMQVISAEFIEKHGKLYRRETFRSSVPGGPADQIADVPCGRRVTWRGKMTDARFVVHFLKTGELINRIPTARDARPFRAYVRGLDGRLLHLGYFGSLEEKNAAVFLWRITSGKPLRNKVKVVD